MRGLTIIVASADPVRFQTALRIAVAHAAMGGGVRMLLDGEAAALAAADDPLLESCFDFGVAVTVCQGGLATAGLDAALLDPRFTYGGIVGVLAELGDDRLVIA